MIEKEQQIIDKLNYESTLIYNAYKAKGNILKLGECCNIRTGKLNAESCEENGIYPFFTCGQDELSINHYAFDCQAIIISGNGEISVKYYAGKFNAYQRTYVLEPQKYFFLFLKECELNINDLKNNSQGSVIKFITKNMLESIFIYVNDESKITNDKIQKIYFSISNSKNKIKKLKQIKTDLLIKYF